VTLVPAEQVEVDEITREPHKKLLLGFFPDQRSAVDPAALMVEKVPFRIGPIEAARAASANLTEVVRLTVLGIGRIVTGDISFKTVGGPIMLFSIASEAAEEGWGTFLFQMALISVNLGLMNLLPIPVLDGGHIAQAALESVTRRPLSVRAREIANIVGLILLFTLMLFVFKNDIVRLMG
jgi:regulator of sigma E protease